MDPLWSSPLAPLVFVAPHERLIDLEERLDFAERLLASGRNEPLPGGH